VLSVEPGDIDQHQVDALPVLGGSTAGMFVRRRLWDSLNGLDEAFPLFRDGVEFGWRANRHGDVVRACPQSSLVHWQAGRRGVRSSAITRDPARLDRVLGMRVVVAHSAHRLSAQSMVVFGCLVQAVGFLLGKAPSRAVTEMRAAVELLANSRTTAEAATRVSAVPEGARHDPSKAWLLPTATNSATQPTSSPASSPNVSRAGDRAPTPASMN